MKKFFSIHQAAQLVGMTAETLRHYDRIGLVSPAKRDGFTGYRYYTQQEIVRLNTVRALRYMDLSLSEIKKILEMDTLENVIAYFRKAEKMADDKIAKLQYAKAKIRAAREDYEKKQTGPRDENRLYTQRLEKRVILLSDALEQPSLDNLWQYHSHFYGQLEPALQTQFTFEDAAGVYTKGGFSRLFAVCLEYPENAGFPGLLTLPAGLYLCEDCPQERREQLFPAFCNAAKKRLGTQPAFAVQKIVVSGILHWDYQFQILLQEEPQDLNSS